ncbi:hypothetical protein HMPREF0653_01923 [Prevotella disiens JCM 6334 = ATCC 29426]|uniref:Uncharacterized protein n=1 Tax=Prevotella disiens JCM 6334 = ATCC 29426 TaxID=1235811 RepID=A0ABN0NQU2_9BACT|nr:hypothetical protein HMPREF0653_01923 [Prevotella disiens JCM 6334 = ATCC 29426]
MHLKTYCFYFLRENRNLPNSLEKVFCFSTFAVSLWERGLNSRTCLTSLTIPTRTKRKQLASSKYLQQ